MDTSHKSILVKGYCGQSERTLNCFGLYSCLRLILRRNHRGFCHRLNATPPPAEGDLQSKTNQKKLRETELFEKRKLKQILQQKLHKTNL